MVGEVATPDYIPAVIAVVGTLTGALLTAIFAVIVASISARGQRRTIQAQLDHASLEATRDLRRLVYSEYLEYMDRWLNLTEVVSFFVAKTMAQQQGMQHEAGFDADAERSRLEKMQSELGEQWAACIARLSLVSSVDVWVLAGKIMTSYVEEIHHAWSTDDREVYLDVLSPVPLYDLMRRDIGIVDEKGSYAAPIFGARPDGTEQRETSNDQ